MTTPSRISALILTYNEEANVERCVQSLAEWTDEIIVIDSFSTDRTLEICRKYTDRIYQHAFENHGRQVNWALDTVPMAGEWVIQLDADEMILPELAAELVVLLPRLGPDVTGVYAKRRVYFMGRWIKHGDYYPMWLLRIFRRGKARNEEFEEDRVVLLEGRAVRARHDFVDYNRRGLSLWVDKHNLWSVNEMRDTLEIGVDSDQPAIAPNLFGDQDQRRRWLKKNFYARCPLFVRAFGYFGYRYVVRLGFLDGVEGLIFHFLQGCWYRFLVDAKIYEARKFGIEHASATPRYAATKPWTP
jgi:glycosyltransferase involved in cell wall biosynthesis